MAGILLPKCLQGSPAHHPWWQQLLTTVTFLFMDMAGNISFLIQSITKIYDLGFDFGVGTIWKGLKGIIVLWPVGSSQTSTPVFLPGEFRGHRSLAGYSPQGRTELDMAEVT